VTGLHSQSRGACACPPCTVRSRCDSLQTPGRSVVALLLRAVRSPDRFLVCFHQLRQGLCLGHHFASPPGGALGRLLHKAVHAARPSPLTSSSLSRSRHLATLAFSALNACMHGRRMGLLTPEPRRSRREVHGPRSDPPPALGPRECQPKLEKARHCTWEDELLPAADQPVRRSHNRHHARLRRSLRYMVLAMPAHSRSVSPSTCIGSARKCARL
jgi:hypothetical protein